MSFRSCRPRPGVAGTGTSASLPAGPVARGRGQAGRWRGSVWRELLCQSREFPVPKAWSRSKSRHLIRRDRRLPFLGAPWAGGMTFTTSTSGNILFSRQHMLPPLTVSNPSFVNYAQTYDPVNQRLVVNFSIVFPDCTLPVFAVFEAA